MFIFVYIKTSIWIKILYENKYYNVKIITFTRQIYFTLLPVNDTIKHLSHKYPNTPMHDALL